MKKVGRNRPAFSKIYHPISVHSFYNLCLFKERKVWRLGFVNTAKILEKMVYVHDSSILHVYKVKDVKLKNRSKALKYAQLLLL